MLSDLRLKALLPSLSCCLALLLWASSAYFSVTLKRIPPFQLTAFVMACLFLIKSTQIAFTKDWSRLKQPLSVYFIGALSFIGFHLFYYLAFKLAPAAEVDLINYLWPVLVIVCSGLLPGHRFSKVHLLSGIIGFFAIWILLQGEFSRGYLIGYASALFGACCWVVYTLIRRYYSHTSSDVIGIYAGVSAFFCFFLHSLLETAVAPTPIEWRDLTILGFIIVGCANTLWDYGLKRGSIQTLSVFSYFTPIVSILILVAMGKSELTPSITISAILVVIASSVPVLFSQKVEQTNSI